MSFNLSLFSFFLTLFFFVRFLRVEDNNLFDNFQFMYTFHWSSLLNITYSVGIDGLSLFFVILTSFLTPICILVS